MRSDRVASHAPTMAVIALVNTGLTSAVGFATGTPLNFAAAALWGGLAALLLRK